MMTKYLLSLVLFFALLPAADAGAAKVRIVVESPTGLQQKVYMTRPAGLTAERPIVIVMHGMRRNADEYRDQWHELAKEHNFLLVVPEFSERFFPGSEAYNLGNVFDASGKPQPKAAWSFSAIEPIFDAVRRRFHMTARGYALYGHSAGAQFVHRFLFHVPTARVTRVVAANAGWYTMPVFNVAFPYGLRDSVVSSADLAAALQLPVTVLLGGQDIDPQHRSLNRSPEALLQGSHRHARGQAFFDSAADASNRLGVPFGWQLLTVPEADHDNRLMAPAALPLLLEPAHSERLPPAPVPVPGEERLPATLPDTGP
jgi:poly(3-hydroxybutyrate) depolymerase